MIHQILSSGSDALHLPLLRLDPGESLFVPGPAADHVVDRVANPEDDDRQAAGEDRDVQVEDEVGQDDEYSGRENQLGIDADVGQHWLETSDKCI